MTHLYIHGYTVSSHWHPKSDLAFGFRLESDIIIICSYKVRAAKQIWPSIPESDHFVSSQKTHLSQSKKRHANSSQFLRQNT